MCGGTALQKARRHHYEGLSPRVRGNRGPAPLDPQRRGSIPACAGEPAGCCPLSARKPVYPRVCGGTGAGDYTSGVARGLSPRVRGNPYSSILARKLPRSIPACAGEPGRRNPPEGKLRVYPRVCGGTAKSFARGQLRRGLSPRVRGNRRRRRRTTPRRGSIPACAGEPSTISPVRLSR